MNSAKRKVRRRKLWTLQGGCCALCLGEVMHPDDCVGDMAWKPSAPTLDHAVPASQGGTWDLRNLLLTHRRCNERRGVAPLPAGAVRVWNANLDQLERAAA